MLVNVWKQLDELIRETWGKTWSVWIPWQEENFQTGNGKRIYKLVSAKSY